MTSAISIDQVRLLQTLQSLLAIPSPVGRTDTICQFIINFLSELGIETQQQRRGTVIATIPTTSKSSAQGELGIAAHLDTLGAMVERVKENGRLALTPLGTWSSRFAEGARATVFSNKQKVRGSILPLLASGHAFNDLVDSQPVNWQQVEMRLDIKTTSREQTLAYGVSAGDIIAVDPKPEFLDNGFLVSRYLDNKAGVACVLEALQTIKQLKLKVTRPVRLMFTIAEEIGLGATSCLSDQTEDLIAVDISPSAPGQEARETGVTLGMKDSLGPHDIALLSHLEQLCASHNIEVRRDVFRHYHSDCSSALRAGWDVRTALVTFGTDATHGYERTHIDSLESVSKLLLLAMTA